MKKKQKEERVQMHALLILLMLLHVLRGSCSRGAREESQRKEKEERARKGVRRAR